MEKEVFAILVVLLISSLKFECDAVIFDDVPRIIVRDGHLNLFSATDKNISISLRGRSSFNVNDIDLLKVIKNFGKATSPRISDGGASTSSDLPYDVQLSTLRAELFGRNGLEKRIVQLENATRIGRLNFRFRNIQTRLTNIERRIEVLEDKAQEDNCRSNPCQNGGTCIDLFGSFLCRCPSNWEGSTCGVDVNECAQFAGTDQGCQNGADCVNRPGSYSCTCKPGWVGIHCTQRYADCLKSSAVELCGHGTCINTLAAPGYTCVCEQGWKTNGITPICNVDINECEETKPPCASQCINLPGSFTCGPCPAGFTGNGFTCRDLNECDVNNGGCSISPRVPCINSYGSYHCGDCPLGWTGDGKRCSITESGSCSRNICHPSAACREISNVVVCTCPPGMSGDGIGPSGCVPVATDPCANRCRNGGTCIANGTSYTCICPQGLVPPNCEVPNDQCSLNPCRNGATCIIQANRQGFRCICPPRYRGRRCQLAQTRCGGVLTAVSGTLKYPLTTTYENNIRCAWLITTNTSKVLEIEFVKFDIESSAGCLFDWLQIHDGPGSAAQLIGRFCGSQLPKGGKIISTHNALYFWFRSDGSTAHNGFELNWKTIEPVCGGMIETTSYGTISSPGAPGNYPPNRDCEWRVIGPFGKRIQLTFFVMALEAHEDCGFDYLAIHDGDSQSSPILQKFCNSSHPSPILTSSHEATLVFHSDGDNTDAGFQIHYAVVAGYPGCGGIFTASKGAFTSPNDNGRYLPAMNCDYLIKLPVGSRIKLHFTEFGVEYSEACFYDYLEIFDGETEQDPKINRYCGLNMPPDLLSESNAMLIKFVTDFEDADKGFKVEYDTVCGGKFKDSEGILMSPMYPNPYAHNRICLYEIMAPVGKAVQLTFQDFGIEGHLNEDNETFACNMDSIEIFEGISTESTRKYCGTKIPPSVISKSNLLTLKLSTDESISGRGFKANYSFFDIGCGGVLTEPHLIIRPPMKTEFNDGTYKDSANCEWVISAPPGYFIHLSWISFQLEQTSDCVYDFVEIFENGTEFGSKVGRYCGNEKPPALTSSSNIVTIKFESDSRDSGEGFMATYYFLDSRKACGGNFHSTSGVLKSPGYPDEYSSDKNCIWTISVPTGNQIELNVKKFELESEARCQYDYLEIRNGNTETSPLIGKYCGVDMPQRIPSFSNQMYLKFVSDYSGTGAGFEIEWDGTLTGCGGNIATYRGTITSPNYPGPYGHDAQCDWRITVSQGSTIDIIIPELLLEPSTTCFYDYIEIYDGLGARNHKIGRYCSSFNDILHVKTNKNEALIRFVSDVSNANKGFLLSYSTNCNNELNDLQGVIESPNFPSFYPDNTQCKWTIKGRKSSKIVVHFAHIDLEGDSQTDASDPCPYDYIEISEKIGKRFAPTKKICKKPVEPFESSSEEVQITFKADDSGHASGFRLEYKIEGCGALLTQPTAEFSSPEYPNSYPHNAYCEWIIEVEYGNLIELNITDMQLEGINFCEYDGVLVANGKSAEQKIATYCGNIDNSTMVRSNGNTMFVQFYSDATSSGRGFKAVYKQVPAKCGGIFKSHTGSIHSPNYPHNYEPNLECEWLIQVDEFSSIHFSFSEFDLEVSPVCVHDYVAIYEGTEVNPDKILLDRSCGNNLPNITNNSTRTNSMLVVMQTDSDTEYKGFVLDYQMNCGRLINVNDSGTLSMKSDDKECIWTLVADPGQHITFTTTHFETSVRQSLRDISDTSETSCVAGGLQFFDGDSISSPLKESFCSKYPHAIVSQGNTLTIKVSSVDISGFGGFYSTYTNRCGGQLSSLSGKLASPLYPDSYPVNIECIWTIEATPGNRLELSIEELDIETSDNCNEDYLEVRDGGPLGDVLGVFCGNNVPATIAGNTALWIKFRSNEDSVGKGFIAQYTYIHDVDITGINGTLTSPRYPDLMTDFKPYNWRVTVPVGHVIQAIFPEGRGEEINPFYNQKFMIFDGYDETATLLTLARDALSFTSSTSSIYIATILPLFKINWTAVSKDDINANKTQSSECRSVITVGQNPQIFKSPGFPTGYKANLDCEWTFESENSIMHPMVQMLHVDIDDQFGCNSDYVQISRSNDRRNWEELAKICKIDGKQTNFFEGNPYLKVVFRSDYYGNKTGFAAILGLKCGGDLTAAAGIIDSSYFADHGIGTNCTWAIQVERGRKIKLWFKQLSLPKNPQGNCPSYVMLKNGESDESPILGSGKYCGTEIPEIPITTTNRAFVKYKNSFPSGTWSLAYETVMNGCEHNIRLDNTFNSTTIATPNFPHIPTPHSMCIWTVIAPMGEHIQIHFESFDLAADPDCKAEYVELKDGATDLSPQLGIFCTQPNTVESSANALRVKYFTDTTDPKAGFNATVSIGKCGGTFHERSGVITSKNYPHLGRYPSNSACDYKIALPVGSMINLTFVDLHLPAGDCSTEDHLSVSFISYGIENVTDTSEYNFCGSYSLPYLAINNNEVLLRFHSYKPNNVYRGFKLHYTSSLNGCGGTIEAEQGVLTTPGYPNGWASTVVCIWRLIVPKGRKIKMEIVDFDTPVSAPENSSIPFRAKAPSPMRIGFFNDHRYLSNIGYYQSSPPPVIYSSDNLMLVTCWLSPVSGYRGIKMKFSSDEPTICDGSLDSINGSISLPTTSPRFICTYGVSKILDHETLAMHIVNMEITNPILRIPCEFRSPVAILDGRNTKIRLCRNVTNEIVRSPFSNTKLQLLQRPQNSILAFNITYRRHQCGGVLQLDDTYNIVTPLVRNPQNPYGPLDCVWFVTKSPGNAFLFKITGYAKLKLGCDKEFLSVSRGPSGPHLQRICGDTAVINISSLNQAFIEYHSDSYDPSSVVNITVDDIEECGDHVFNTPHTIRLKNDYKSNVECIWTMRASSGYHLQAHFVDRFYIEDSVNCTKDVLEISDFSDGKWNVIGRVCGRNRPPIFNSSENMLRIKFRSDATVEGDGFTIQFDNVCGGIYHVRSGLQYLTSPNYPQIYDPNLHCNYTLIAPNSENTILVQFIDFHLERTFGQCRYDNVTIFSYEFSKYTEVGSYCAPNSLSELRYKNRVVILFRSDGSSSRKGFKFQYSLDQCGGTVAETKLIASPKETGTSMYPSNAHCVWNITAPAQKEIIIKFEFLELEASSHCYYDYVHIYKGNKEIFTNRIATLCGNLTGKMPVISIDTNHAMLHFHTDTNNVGRGFNAWVIFKDQCDRKINLDANSPSYSFDQFYGSAYTVNLDCHYVFTAPDGYQIRVEFEQFHMAPCTGNETDRCSCDYFELRDGGGPFSELLGSFCGHNIPPIAISTRPKLFARFVSDSVATSSGIKATFSIVPSQCGKTNYQLEDTKGMTLQTPGDTYPPNLRCLWKVTSMKYYLIVHFLKLDLEGPVSGRCVNDVLQIYNSDVSMRYDSFLDNNAIVNGIESGVVTSYPESISRSPEARMEYCGNKTFPDFYSSSNTVYVSFKSNAIDQRSGFKLHITPVSGCYKNYTESQGRILLLGSYLDCEFYILAPENHTVSIYFNTLYVMDDNCDSQHVAIYDAETGKELAKKCGQVEPSASFFSNTNHLKFKVKNSGIYANYDATYLASSAGIGCGGELRNYGGIFTSPFYPVNARNNSDCRWEIEVPSNMKVALIFDVFDMGAKTTCRSDYLQVIEYVDSGEEVVRQYCGEDKPAPYRGRKNRVAVRYQKTVNFDGTGWVIRFGAIHDDTKLFGVD